MHVLKFSCKSNYLLLMVFNKIKRYPSSSTEENNLSIKFIYMLALLVRLLLLRDEFNSLVKLKTQIRSCEMLKA
jgi:hypothetical protein